ncbi:hypothetical protein OUZ56_033473 [Daphnia magna]|uniref:Uncharacterized protein n=1 Tax=Daphnia magna TaxID=35525 RepID=A0ABQ9ZXX2_9CRUS|nr:hypothetical protein OUZ56_033473 [Daphnia magna]
MQSFGCPTDVGVGCGVHLFDILRPARYPIWMSNGCYIRIQTRVSCTTVEYYSTGVFKELLVFMDVMGPRVAMAEEGASSRNSTRVKTPWDNH